MIARADLKKKGFTSTCAECQHPMVAASEAGLQEVERDHASWHRAPELFRVCVSSGTFERKSLEQSGWRVKQ